MRITLIHPSRNRPQLAIQTALTWLGSCGDIQNIEYLLSLDTTEDRLGEYLSEFDKIKHNIKIVQHENKSAIDAINNAAKIAQGDLFIVISDDFDCFQNWDTTLLKELEGKSDFVVRTLDGTQDWIITLPIMDRVYYNRFGYIYYPSYLHMFCDTEMSHVADLLDRKITIPLAFKHKHYMTGLTPKDHINTKNDSTWSQGEALYLSRIKENFGLTKFSGQLKCGPSHRQWLQNKGIDITNLPKPTEYKYLLSIQIPTIFGREEQFERLFTHLQNLSKDYNNIEIISLKDDKEITIGTKRNLLYEKANAEYSVQIDDDDNVPDYYIQEVIKALIQENPDCVGYLESVIMNGQRKIACHSNSFKDWGENINGYDYARTIFCKDVIKTDIAKKVGVSDLRFAEDHDFAKRLKNSGLLQKEVFIDKIMYNYSFNHLTKDEHNLRYGITRTTI